MSGEGEEATKEAFDIILRGQMTSEKDKRLYRHLDALTRPDESRRKSHLITSMCCRTASCGLDPQLSVFIGPPPT